MDSSLSRNSTVIQRGKALYVEARLQGGAPWGFTLKGGLEHGEALIISKVEEGGKADLLEHPLQPGDQVVVINEVELSGFRQEAISLVKGSYKTLRLTVRRECCPGPCCSEPCEPSLLPSSSSLLPSSSSLLPSSSSRGCSGGVKLRIKNRRSEPASRPHSWHSTKLGEGQQDPSMMQISQGSMGAPWHQTYHSSASTTDLSGYDAGFLRKSPDQYSSRGSMESLDHPHPAYSSCHQLSASKSSNSIDHLHSKRDSAYSSFSTSSSIPEYLAAAPSFSKERSYSMENVPQRGTEGLQQADIRYVRTVYDPQQGVSEEHEVSSAALMRTNESRAQARGGGGGVLAGACHRGSSSSGSSGSSGSSSGGTSHRHSVGPVWGQTHNRNSYESLRGAPAPPLRSDSFAAIRNHERPNSWSTVEQARSLRALHKGSWHHSSGSVASGKSSFGAEGQLHTVIEKSPESSPTIKPKQSFPQASQTGRLMLPTGIYPVPPPEPHFAQMPTSCPSSSSVYPALAKENRYTPQRDQGGGLVSGDGLAVENGYQSNASFTSSGQPHSFSQPKLSSCQQTDRGQEEPQTKCGLYRPHLQAQGYRPSAPSIGQERRDPYTPVQPRGERPKHSHSSTEGLDSHTREEDQSRYTEQSSHSEPVFMPSKIAQGQVGHAHRGAPAPAQGGDPRGSASPRHHSDSSTYQQRDRDRDREHPLTRLENALAEVQRCASPESSSSDRSMSVLEKVSRFERREQAKPRSHSSLSNHSSSTRPSQEPVSAKSSLSGIEDLRCMLERSNSCIPQGRTQSSSSSTAGSYEGHKDLQQEPHLRRGSSDQVQHRLPQDPTLALQRSKSTFQLSEENGKDFHWKDDLQDILGTIQDTSFNRAYRDSIKDAQSKVLRSTSFRRRDLSVNPPPVPVKHMSLERKAPKTSPKPTMTSPHTPKERHIVPVEVVENFSPPELPSVPAVGPPVVRIGGRKRLTMEQKKRSYSEPENMHEVGVSDMETSMLSQFQRKSPQQFLFPETSVADRRRMFELAVSRSTVPKPATYRPELKQMQQDALAEYMERKTGRRVDARPHRPHSAYLQPASSSTDSRSLSSTSSMASLQEPGPEGLSGASHQSSTLPPGLQSCFYPSRGTARTQAEAYAPPYRPQGRTPEPQRQEREPNTAPSLAPAPETLRSHTLSQDRNAVFKRAVPARSSGKSASAEDLLDRTEDRPVPQHYRSRSSPSVEKFNQDFLAGDLRLFGIISSTHSDRALENAKPERPASASASLRVERYLLNQGPSQLNTPVMRRERQRHPDRQRAQSASGLAASVGLPCPFTPPGSTAAGLDWQASERLCRANLDAIAFPFMPQGDTLTPDSRTSGTVAGMARQNSSDTSTSEETLKDFPREGPGPQTPTPPKTTSPPPQRDTKETPAPLSTEPTPMSPPPLQPPLPHPLLSLRISESNLHFAPAPTFSQDDDDDVFLAPPSPPPPPLPIRETDITEDFPPPPPSPPAGEEEEGHVEAPHPSGVQQLSRVAEYLDDMAAHRDTDRNLPRLSPPPVTSEPQSGALRASLSTESEPQSPGSTTAEEAQESLGLEYRLLSRRERSGEELRVEALAKELVSRDKSLTPLLNAWTGKSNMDLMEEIFLAGARSSWQRRRSSWPKDRKQDGVSGSEDILLQSGSGGMETDLDEEEADLNQKKVELLQALTLSVGVLRGEREGLAEEQKRYSSLGSSMEALVQEHCKPNERDKYRMFIGDLDKIVNLLLSLSGRLARVENALSALGQEETEDSAVERETLQQKRRQLCSQHEDARELKENLDRRERAVLDILGGYLSGPQLRDYQHYVRVKPALLIRQRHLDELIKQGDEQLRRLGDSLPAEYHPQTADPAPSPRSTAVTSL